MTEHHDKISFLLDEFSGDEQSMAVLDEVEGDVNLQYNMRRYQLIGEAMRHELPSQIDTEFSANVMAQISQVEIAANVPDDNNSSIKNRLSIWSWSFMKPFAGMALAASVAVVSITLWQSTNVDINSEQATGKIASADEQKIERLASQPFQFNAVNVSSLLNNGTHWKINKSAPALQQKLNAYLVNHTEYSNSLQGLIPQARVAGFDAEK